MKHFSAHTSTAVTQRAFIKSFCQRRSSHAGFLGQTLQKLCLKRTLEAARNKRQEGSSQTKTGNAQKESTLLSHSFNRHYTKLEKQHLWTNDIY